MKKWIAGLATVILLSTISIYVFVPRTAHIKNSVPVTTSADNIQRFLGNETEWNKWWPSTQAAHQYSYNSYNYRVTGKHHRIVEINIIKHPDTFRSNIILNPIRADSVEISWQATIDGTLNPLRRLQYYRQAIELDKNTTQILHALKKFLSQESNIYGISVELTTVKDTLLITAKQNFSRQPGARETYILIRKLQNFIRDNGGRETGFPMLNRRMTDENDVEVMVAIPVDKELQQSPTFAYKRMIPLKILVTQVQGGPGTVENAFVQLENYVQDHRYESPAIPFESLVTDRLNEPDTSKWITRIYYPVF